MDNGLRPEDFLKPEPPREFPPKFEMNPSTTLKGVFITNELLRDAERRNAHYVPTEKDKAMMSLHPAAVANMDAIQERAINAALIAEYAAQATTNEKAAALSIRYFKHKPLVRVYVDDLRRLLELATKGNKA